jgi:hypothetical protein
MTMRSLDLALVGTGVLLSASIAHAQVPQEFGEKGQLIFSADRLFPLVGYSQNKLTDNNANPSQTTTYSSSQISLLWGSTSVSGDVGTYGGIVGVFNGGALGNGASTNVYTVPRLGFDYVIAPHLTLGGNVVFFTTAGSSQNQCDGTNCQTQGDGTGDVIGIAPRIGYVIGLSPMLSLWIRGGLHYYHEHMSIPTQVGGCNNRSDSNNVSAEVGGLDFDPQFVISPVPHFAFIAGPTVDWGFAGSVSTDQPSNTNCNARDTSSVGYAAFNLALTGGILGWF